MRSFIAGAATAALVLCALAPARAERVFWPVPYTKRRAITHACFDPRHGGLLVLKDNQVLRLDPVDGSLKALATMTWQASEPTGPRFWRFHNNPDGSLEAAFHQLGFNGLVRLQADGKHRWLAGEGKDGASCDGDALQAEVTPLTVRQFAVGPGGERFLADPYNGMVHQLLPRGDGGFSVEAILGWGIDPFPGDPFRHLPEPEREAAYRRILPAGIAVLPDGDLVYSDRGNHRIFRCTPTLQFNGKVWRLTLLAGSGDTRPNGGHDDARQTSLDTPGDLQVTEDGRILVAAGAVLWQLSPRRTEAGTVYRSQAIYTAPQLAEQDEAAELSLSLVRGGGILVGQGTGGLGYLGPEAPAYGPDDATLLGLVRRHRQGLAEGNAAECVASMERLRALLADGARGEGEEPEPGLEPAEASLRDAVTRFRVNLAITSAETVGLDPSGPGAAAQPRPTHEHKGEPAVSIAPAASASLAPAGKPVARPQAKRGWESAAEPAAADPRDGSRTKRIKG